LLPIQKKVQGITRGCAVDLSLYDLATGKEITMPGVYDETSERSYPDYKGGTAEQRKMRDLLRSKMEANGFTVYEVEWWHFDFTDWRSYRIQNIPFSEIK
jgi:zinc D-Ala-D-Ala dipeptidase